MVQHQQQRRRIELIVRNRKCFEFATPDFDRRQIPETTTGCLEHFAGSIDGNDPCDEWCQGTCHLTRAATEIADRPSLVHERRKRLQMRGRTKQIGAELVPLPGSALEELLRLRLASGEYIFQPPRILIRPCRGADLIAQQRPQPTRMIAIVQRYRVVATRAVAARDYPSAVGQGLQMTADRRLRELKDRTQLRDGQLVTLQKQQHAAAGRIREGAEVVKNGRTYGRHLLIRISGFMVTRRELACQATEEHRKRRARDETAWPVQLRELTGVRLCFSVAVVLPWPCSSVAQIPTTVYLAQPRGARSAA